MSQHQPSWNELTQCNAPQFYNTEESARLYICSEQYKILDEITKRLDEQSKILAEQNKKLAELDLRIENLEKSFANQECTLKDVSQFALITWSFFRHRLRFFVLRTSKRVAKASTLCSSSQVQISPFYQQSDCIGHSFKEKYSSNFSSN